MCRASWSATWQLVAYVLVTEMHCTGIYVSYGGVNWFKNAKRMHVACGPVHILTLITGLALLRTLAWLLADTSPPTVPVSRRNDAVHCGPVRPCAFCSDPALMAQALTVQAPPTVISAYCARSQNMTIGGATKFLGGQQLLVTILNLLILPMPTMLPSSCLT